MKCPLISYFQFAELTVHVYYPSVLAVKKGDQVLTAGNEGKS